MSAQLDRRPPAFDVHAMRVPDLSEVMVIERQAYPVPWTHGNFVDSLASNYPAEVLRGAGRQLLGYWMAMPGVDEMHLLNLTVAPHWQGHGLAVALLDRVVAESRQRGLPHVLLEVRLSNERAQEVYRRYGFTVVGRRRAYYPVTEGPREDALLMNLAVGA